jgi:hypothetical protein
LSAPPPPPQFPPQGYPPYAPPYFRPDAPGATPAMVLGIVALAGLPVICCCGLGELIVLPIGIIAVVLGVQARSKIAGNQGAYGGDGKALAGIVMGATAAGIGLVLLVLYALGAIASGGGMFNNFALPSPSG